MDLISEAEAQRILRERRVEIGPDDHRTHLQIAIFLGYVSIDGIEVTPPQSEILYNGANYDETGDSDRPQS